MSIAKNIEVSSTSSVSFEDAMQQGISKVCQSVNHVKGAWVKEQKVSIDGGKVVEYNVTMIVSFIVDGSQAIDQ